MGRVRDPYGDFMKCARALRKAAASRACYNVLALTEAELKVAETAAKDLRDKGFDVRRVDADGMAWKYVVRLAPGQ